MCYTTLPFHSTLRVLHLQVESAYPKKGNHKTLVRRIEQACLPFQIAQVRISEYNSLALHLTTRHKFSVGLIKPEAAAEAHDKDSPHFA